MNKREIKFRGWHKPTNKMVDLLKITPLALSGNIPGLFLPFDDGIILMPFTGLLDKNGVGVFENDVIRYSYYFDYGQTGEYKSYFAIVTYDITRAAFDPFYKWSDYEVSVKKDVEVIGNLFENPELLEKESPGNALTCAPEQV